MKYYKSVSSLSKGDIWKVYPDRQYDIYSTTHKKWIRQGENTYSKGDTFLFADWLILSWELKELTKAEAYIEIL